MHIKQVIIRDFFRQGNIVWNLEPDVNILVGKNGTGKTRIINMLAEVLSKNNNDLDFASLHTICEEVEVVFDNDQSISIDSNSDTHRRSDGSMIIDSLNCELIQTFNTPVTFFDVKVLKAIEQLGFEIKTTLDYELAKYVNLFRIYKQNIENEILAKIRKKETVYTAQLFEGIDKFYDLVNKFFEDTNKKIDDSKEPFYFLPQNISFTSLSSGEKQLLLLLLVVFLQDKKDAILLLDEPEIALHFSWQRNLIETLHKLNPHCQLIIVTHSSSIYSENWLGNRKLLSEIIQTFTNENQIVTEYVPMNQMLEKPNKLLSVLKGIISISEESPINKTYQINIRLKEERRMSIELCREVINLMKKNNIQPDQITLGTLLNHIDTFENGKLLIKEVDFEPNAIAMNQLLKKTSTLEDGISFIKDNFNKEFSFPDIISFSTIIGKTHTKEELIEVENLRLYYEIKSNELYHSKFEYLLKQRN